MPPLFFLGSLRAKASTPEDCYRSRHVELGTVLHTCNSSTQEAEVKESFEPRISKSGGITQQDKEEKEGKGKGKGGKEREREKVAF